MKNNKISLFLIYIIFRHIEYHISHYVKSNNVSTVSNEVSREIK